jgi:predicted AlkP superfamily phosphohydrolase/phosphomutase
MTTRVLRSAALASTVLAADAVLLTLFLNPNATLAHDGGALVLALFVPYWVAGTAAFALVAAAASALPVWPRRVREPLPGLAWFTGLALLATAAGALLFWLNAIGYRHSIPLESVRGLLQSAIALSVASLVLLAVCLDVLLFPERSRGIAAPLVVLAAAAAVTLPLALRPAPQEPARPVRLATETTAPVRRIILLGIDGLGPAQLQAGVGSNSLPGLARILRRGAHGALGTLEPTEGPPIWTTILTGRLPRDHGIKSFTSYRLRGSPTVFELLPRGALVGALERLGLVSTLPVTSSARRRRALWDDLNAFGVQTGVVRIWGTYPAEHVKGFMLSPYFHLVQSDPPQAARTLYPSELAAEVRARVVRPEDVDPALVSEFVDPSVASTDGVPWREELVDHALAPDLTYQRAGALLRTTYDPPFFATYQYGLDVVGHRFMRYAQPDWFGNVRPEAIRKYGHVSERYAAMLSEWVDGYARALKPGEILLVVSGYGMEPVPLWRRAWEATTGDRRSGTHAGAPDGLILAIGDGIRPGAVVHGASVLDVTPTVLYLMGLPVARDMEGRVLAELLEEDFARAHPVTFIPSYESLAVTALSPEPAPLTPPLPEETP